MSKLSIKEGNASNNSSNTVKQQTSWLTPAEQADGGGNSIVFMYTTSFKDSVPLLLYQWYLSHLHRAVRFGKAEEPYPWMVTSISTPEYIPSEMPTTNDSNNIQSVALGEKERQKKKWKKENITLLPSTTVFLSFPHYRVVVCLDISWTVSSIGSPFGVLTSSLLSIISKLSEATCRGDTNSTKVLGIQLSIIAHSPELDETWCLWQGEITSDSDTLLLQSIVRTRVEHIQDESFRSQASRMSSVGNLRFPESETFLKAILFHMNLMPGDACPKAILLTSGSMAIKLGENSLVNQFSKNQISLHVVVEQISCDRPVGFYSDLQSLRLLVEHTAGGTVKVLRSGTSSHINAVCNSLVGESFLKLHIFGPTLMSNNDDSCCQGASGGSIAEEVHPVMSYLLEGATVDHLLSFRRAEGFRIINVVHEKENIVPPSMYAAEPDSPSFTVKKSFAVRRQQPQQQQQTFTVVTITLEKSISKLCRLSYEIEYRQQDMTTGVVRRASFMAKQRGQLSIASAAAATAAVDASGTSVNSSTRSSLKAKVKQTWDRAPTITGGAGGAKAINQTDLVNLFETVTENLSWVKGPFTISIRRLTRSPSCSMAISMHDDVAKRGHSTGTRAERVSVALAQTMSERDKSLAALLGSDYMPGSTGLSEALMEFVRSQNDLVSPLHGGTVNQSYQRYSAGGNTNRLGLPSPSRGRREQQEQPGGAGAEAVWPSRSAAGLLHPRPFPTSKRLSSAIDVLEDVCALDKITTFHMFLCCDQTPARLPSTELPAFAPKPRRKDMQGMGTQKGTSKLSPQTLKRIFEGIASNLPHPDSRRLSPSKCLYVISNMSREIGSLHPLAIDFGVVIVEIIQRDDAFLTIKVSKLAKCCGQLAALVKIVIKSFFLTIKASGLRAVKVKSDLSQFSLAPVMGSYQRRMVESCLSSAQSSSHFHVRHVANLRLLLRELVLSKIAVGFQLVGDAVGEVLAVPSSSTTVPSNNLLRGYNSSAASESLYPMSSAEQQSSFVVHLFAVSPASPSGIDVEALLQCKISCAMDECSVVYYWPRCVHDAQDHEKGAAAYSANAARANATIEMAVEALIAVDRSIFSLYENVTPLVQKPVTVYPCLRVTTTSLFPSLRRNAYSSSSRGIGTAAAATAGLPQVFLSVQQWLELTRHSSVESLLLPRFDDEANPALTCKLQLNYRLLRMLQHSLSRLNGNVLGVVLKPSATVASCSESHSHLHELGTGTATGTRDLFVITVNADLVVFVEFPAVRKAHSPPSTSSDSVGTSRCVSSALYPPPTGTIISKVTGESKVDMTMVALSDSQILREESHHHDSFFIEPTDGIDVMSESSFRADQAELDPYDAGLSKVGDAPVSNTSAGSASVPPAGGTAATNTCEVKLYPLQLPTLRFADDPSMKLLTARAIIHGPKADLSRSSHGGLEDLHLPNSRPLSDRLNVAKVTRLKDFLLASHLHNFTTVMGTAMRRGAELSPGDVQLGVEKCRHVTYEVDLSVMCRKRYLASLSQGSNTATTMTTVHSLCGAFENTLGRLLKGSESGGVFVLKDDADDVAGPIMSLSSEENQRSSIRESKSNDEIKEHLATVPPVGTIAAKGTESIRVSKSFGRLPATSVTETKDTVGSSPGLTHEKKMDATAAAAATSHELHLSQLAMLDKDLCKSRPAVFVRFAVVSKMEKVAVMGGMTTQTASAAGAGYPQHGSTKSAHASATVTQAQSYAGGGVIGVVNTTADESQQPMATIHPLPCFSMSLSESLHGLCSSLGQVLESSSHSAAAATEVALRMTCMYADDLDSDESADGSSETIVATNVTEEATSKDAIQKSFDDKSNSFYDKLSQEMRIFVASDILNSLLAASTSNITAETLVLVQHCLNDISSLVCNAQTTLDFVCPASMSSMNTKRVTAGNAASEIGSTVNMSSGVSGQLLGGANQYDPVVAAFETELRGEVSGLAKIGETLYARSWQMRSPYPRKRKDSAPETVMPAEGRSRAATTADVPPPTPSLAGAVSEMATMSAAVATNTATRAEASMSTEAVVVEIPSDLPLVVPCWILITLVHNTQPDGDMVAMGTATTSMKVSIALRKTDTPDAQSNLSIKTSETLTPNIAVSSACRDAYPISGASGESDGLQDAIAAEIIAVLEKCSFRVNQRLLLRDLLATRVASPYLIAPPVAITAEPEAAGPSATAEPTGQQTPSTATPSNLLIPTPTTSQPADATSQPPPAMAATAAATAAAKTKSNIFNNTVPPRRRPPIPTLSVMVSKNGSSTNAKPVVETVIPPKNLVFPLGRFSCARQGEIHCAIHAWAALSHENAVRHLETSALSHFVVTNHERYFVSQDSLGHVVYLSFDPPERESVRLGVYGTHPLDTVFSNQLQVLLDHRLIEFTAKAVSAVLLRNASLHTSYMSFLKQSGSSRHLTVKFVLPRYVQDVYFYCTIVRQIFLNTHVLGRVTLGGGGGSALGGEKKAAAVKSAAELMHPSSFGYNLLNENNILAGSRESSEPSSATSSPRQTLLKRPSSVHVDDKNDGSAEPSAGRGPVRKSYAGAVTGGDYANHQGDISTPRKIFGDTPITGLGLAARRSFAIQSAAMNRPKLVRKKHVEAEVADSRIISPVFFGKKKNLSKPRREFRFDETLVVWQKIEFSFLYNVLGPATASSSAQYKHGMKMIGQGLALIELSPQHVKSPASAFPSSGASGNNPSQPLILLTGSQLALEDDIVALEEHVRSRESFTMKPYVDPSGSNLPIPTAESGSSSAGSKSSPEAVREGARSRSASNNSYDGAGKVLPGSCSEIHLRIYPTIPMQTQVLADFCTACMEKALVVYSMERLISACGTGLVSETITASASIVRSTVISGSEGSEGSTDTSYATRARTASREKHMLTPENSLLPSPLFSDFLRLCHGTLAAATSPSAFIGRSMGIMRFPAILPRQKAQAVRMQIVDRLLDTYPALRTAAVECSCNPLFIPPSSDHAFAGDSGVRDVDSEGSSSIGNVVWCDTSTGGSSAGTRGTSTLLGLSNLSGTATLSPGGSMSYGGDLYQQNIETLSLPTSTTEPGSYGSIPASSVSVASSAAAMSRVQSDRLSLLNKTGTASSAQHPSHFLRRTPSLATDKKGHDNQVLNSASGSIPGPSSSTLTMTTATAGGAGSDLRSLTNSDPTIIGSLPLWLRKRNFSLEICVSTEGVLVFFFNLAPAVVNAICEVCANITAAGLRQHNEQLRQQLAMLGVLKAPPLPPPNYFPINPIPVTIGDASSSLPSSPLRMSMPSVSPTLLSSMTASHSGLFGGGPAGVPSVVTASSILGPAQPSAATVRVIVPPKSGVATDGAMFEWLAKAVNRMCWDRRTLERLQKHHTQTSTHHSYPQVEPLLRIHPRSWRDGVLLSSAVLPLPYTSCEPTGQNSGHDNSPLSPFDAYLVVVQELCDVLDFDLLVHNSNEVGTNAPTGGAFVVAPIPRTAVVAVAELSCVVLGTSSSGSNDDDLADTTALGVTITVRMMDIVDIIKVASRIGLLHENAYAENASVDSSSSHSSSLVARCRELLVGLPSLSISAEQTLQSFGSSSSSSSAEGPDDELLDWSVIDNPVVCKLQKNLALGTFIAFDRALRLGVDQGSNFYEQRISKHDDQGELHRCGGRQLVQSLVAVLGDTMLVEEVSLVTPRHQLLVRLPSVPEILRCAASDRSTSLPDVLVLPSGRLCFRIACVDLTGRVVAKGFVLTSVTPDAQAVIVAAYHAHESAVDTTNDLGDQCLRPLTILLPSSDDVLDDEVALAQVDTFTAVKTSSSSSSSSSSSTFSPRFQLVVREACSTVTHIMESATKRAVLKRSWTALQQLCDDSDSSTHDGSLLQRKNVNGFVNANLDHAFELKQLMGFLCSKDSSLPLSFLESFREPLVALDGKGDKMIERMAIRLSRLPSSQQCIYFTEGSTHHIIVVALPAAAVDGISVVTQLLHVYIKSTNETALCRLFGDNNSSGEQLIGQVVEVLLFSISKAF